MERERGSAPHSWRLVCRHAAVTFLLSSPSSARIRFRKRNIHCLLLQRKRKRQRVLLQRCFGSSSIIGPIQRTGFGSSDDMSKSQTVPFHQRHRSIYIGGLRALPKFHILFEKSLRVHSKCGRAREKERVAATYRALARTNLALASLSQETAATLASLQHALVFQKQVAKANFSVSRKSLLNSKGKVFWFAYSRPTGKF